MMNEQDARIYATARVDALETALKANDAEGAMAVYRQMVADGYADAAEDMMCQIIAAGLKNLAHQPKPLCGGCGILPLGHEGECYQ